MSLHAEEAALLIFCVSFLWGQRLKERICSCMSKFIPLSVDPMPTDIHKKKQTCIHASQYNII